jgi:hypothetical protein
VTTYRGIRCARANLKPVDTYTEDGTVELWPITSTSRKISRIQKYLGKSKCTILALECRHAIDIRPFSAFKSSEEEFLLIPGSTFEVTSVLDKGELSIVQMVEDRDLGFGEGMS